MGSGSDQATDGRPALAEVNFNWGRSIPDQTNKEPVSTFRSSLNISSNSSNFNNVQEVFDTALCHKSNTIEGTPNRKRRRSTSPNKLITSDSEILSCKKRRTSNSRHESEQFPIKRRFKQVNLDRYFHKNNDTNKLLDSNNIAHLVALDTGAEIANNTYSGGEFRR